MNLMKKPHRSRHYVDTETFVRTWMQVDTIVEVAEQMEMSIPQASNKASSLRRRGINIPRKRGGPSEVERLNKLIASYKKRDA